MTNMDAHRTDGIIDFQLLVNELHAEHHGESGDDADDGGTGDGDGGATGGDSDKTGERTVQRHDLIVQRPFDLRGGDGHVFHLPKDVCEQIGRASCRERV